MIELGELEAHHADFSRRNARLVVASTDGRDEAAKTQAEFPHLIVVADADVRLIGAAGLVHNAASTMHKDAAAPATVLIDRQGQACWLFRPDRYLERLSPAELLAAVDAHLSSAP